MLEYILPSKTFRNRDGRREFDFTLHRGNGRVGVSALMRVKNEESKIEYALRSILPVFDEIVVADNNSTDRTAELVEAIRQEHDDGHKIRLISYPYALSRCGPEHGETPSAPTSSATKRTFGRTMKEAGYL